MDVGGRQEIDSWRTPPPPTIPKSALIANPETASCRTREDAPVRRQSSQNSASARLSSKIRWHVRTPIIGIDPATTPSGTGCEECLAAGTRWLHLRRCTECGHIGCCDSSPHRHATKHFRATGHPIIRSFEPGETWCWNFETNTQVRGEALALPVSHPEDQP